MNITNDAFLEQVITQPSRITEMTAHTLDLFITSNPTLVNKVEVIPGFSDHEVVFLEMSLPPREAKVTPGQVFIYKNADFDPMSSKLQEALPSFQGAKGAVEVENLWNEFNGQWKTKQFDGAVCTKQDNIGW